MQEKVANINNNKNFLTIDLEGKLQIRGDKGSNIEFSLDRKSENKKE